MRRQKDPDEIALLRQLHAGDRGGPCLGAGQRQAGHDRAGRVLRRQLPRASRRPGTPVIVYGDFAVSPGPERRGGPPTDRVLEPGDMLILDFSVVIDGYRSDFTNTLVVGKEPTPDQQRLYDLCRPGDGGGREGIAGRRRRA